MPIADSSIGIAELLNAVHRHGRFDSYLLLCLLIFDKYVPKETRTTDGVIFAMSNAGLDDDTIVAVLNKLERS